MYFYDGYILLLSLGGGGGLTVYFGDSGVPGQIAVMALYCLILESSECPEVPRTEHR